MSRTYRRKNYEETQGTSWDKNGRKVNGFYTKKDRTKEFYPQLYGIHGCPYGMDYWYFYRPMNAIERGRKWKRIHTDSSWRWGPGKIFRRFEEKKLRSFHRQEIYKVMVYPEYEIMCYANRQLPYWD